MPGFSVVKPDLFVSDLDPDKKKEKKINNLIGFNCTEIQWNIPLKS